MPITCNAIHVGEKVSCVSGYMIDCVDHRLLLRKWPAVKEGRNRLYV